MAEEGNIEAGRFEEDVTSTVSRMSSVSMFEGPVVVEEAWELSLSAEH